MASFGPFGCGLGSGLGRGVGLESGVGLGLRPCTLIRTGTKVPEQPTYQLKSFLPDSIRN